MCGLGKMKADSATGSGGAEWGAAAAELPFSHTQRIFAPGQAIATRHAPEARMVLRGGQMA